MYAPDSNSDEFYYTVLDGAPQVVPQEIDAGAKKLEPPSIIDINLAREARVSSARKASQSSFNQAAKDLAGAITVWETPYNRPDYKSKEHIDFTKSAFQHIQQGRVEHAEKLLLRAHKLIKNSRPRDLGALIKSVENLAWVFFSSRKYQAAEPYAVELVSYRIREHEPADPQFVIAVDQLAEIYTKTGRQKDCNALYKFLLAMQTDHYGRQNTAICPTLRKLAGIYLEEGRLVAAEAYLLRILHIFEPVYGRSSLEVSTLLEQLSEVYRMQQRFDKAAEMLERLLHVLESIHGENAIAVASCLLKLADLLSQVNMVSEAEPLYRRVIAIYEVAFGKKTAEISVSRKRTETMTRLPAYQPYQRSQSETQALDTIREIGRQVREKNAFPERELGLIGV